MRWWASFLASGAVVFAADRPIIFEAIASGLTYCAVYLALTYLKREQS